MEEGGGAQKRREEKEPPRVEVQELAVREDSVETLTVPIEKRTGTERQVDRDEFRRRQAGGQSSPGRTRRRVTCNEGEHTRRSVFLKTWEDDR